MKTKKKLDIEKTYVCAHGYEWKFVLRDTIGAPYNYMWKTEPDHYKLTDAYGQSMTGPDLIEDDDEQVPDE